MSYHRLYCQEARPDLLYKLIVNTATVDGKSVLIRAHNEYRRLHTPENNEDMASIVAAVNVIRLRMLQEAVTALWPTAKFERISFGTNRGHSILFQNAEDLISFKLTYL